MIDSLPPIVSREIVLRAAEASLLSKTQLSILQNVGSCNNQLPEGTPETLFTFSDYNSLFSWCFTRELTYESKISRVAA